MIWKKILDQPKTLILFEPSEETERRNRHPGVSYATEKVWLILEK